MAVATTMHQHLEMMLNKKSRCEDWVSSVTFGKQCSDEDQVSNPKDEEEVSVIADECSDVACNTSDVSHRRSRKKVKNEKLALILSCEWYDCDYGTTDNRTKFTQHVSSHVSEVPVVQKSDGSPCYQCVWEKCSFQSSDPSEIKRHIYFHVYITTLKAIASTLNILWELPACTRTGENTDWWSTLSSAFKCEIFPCEYQSDNFEMFIHHVNSHVDCQDLTVEPIMFCRWKGCTDFKCRKKTFMKIHLRRHTGEKSLACPSCGTMFASNTKYMDHCNRKVPVRDESNQCQYCLRYYPNDRLLRDHMRYHINSQKCSFCEMTFSTPSVLANHIRYKHIKVRPFQCSLCSFAGIKAKDFTAHMATHEIQPRYQCGAEDCDYSCRTQMTLKRHFNSVHLQSAPPIYQCHLCEKEYNRGPPLGTHLRTVHKLERLPGHSRFRYMENKDGYYRLQVERYESLELNNFRGPLVAIDDKMNFNLKEQPTDNEDSPKKFTISIDENENRKTKSSVIAIDELDELGNVVYSTTVQKKLMDNTDFYFVDVEKCTEPDPSSGDGLATENTLEIGNLSTSTTEIRAVKKTPKRKRRLVTFSDHDCILDETVVSNL